MQRLSPLATIIIPTHDDGTGLGSCLAALERQTVDRGEYEIIVVNDGPVDDAVKAVTEKHRGLFLHQPQRGAGAARNLGAEHAKGELLLFTDVDCIPAPDWIEKMTAPFADPDVMGVCGVVRTRQRGLVPRFVQLEYEHRYRNVARHTRIDFVNTGAAAYRREIFLQSGGFDPALLGAEDMEFSYRLAGQGHRLIFASQAIVYHPHPTSILAYARRKCHYGYWRMAVYQQHPDKVVSDSRTPQTQKLRIGALGLLGIATIGTLFWRSLGWVAGASALLFLITALPFWWWVLRRDLLVGLFTPLFIVAGTAGSALGVTGGLVRRRFK